MFILSQTNCVHIKCALKHLTCESTNKHEMVLGLVLQGSTHFFLFYYVSMTYRHPSLSALSSYQKNGGFRGTLGEGAALILSNRHSSNLYS